MKAAEAEREGGGDSKGGRSKKGVEEGCLVDREKEKGREKERGEERQAKCAQYSFKVTEAVCVLVCTSYSSSVSHWTAYYLKQWDEEEKNR